MKAELKAKWLTALRSGLYRKSCNTLKRHYKTQVGYCCLGVLCDVITPEFPDAQELVEKEYYTSPGSTPKSKNAMLDHPTMRYVGLDQTQQRKLSTMNDNGASFSTIADYIERRIPGE